MEGIIQRIADESELGEEELKERIERKREELGGLITPEGAAYIVANEIGINLFEGESKAPELKLGNVIPGMKSVNVAGNVMRIYAPKEFDKKDGSTGRMSSLILGDETGTIRVVFWGKEIDMIEEGKLKEGDVLMIQDGYSKEDREGKAEIHVASRSGVIVNPSDIEPKDVLPPETGLRKISELKEGTDSVDLLCKVLRVHEVREFEREDKDKEKGKVVNLLVADETGKARLALWDADVGLVEKGEVKEGDTIKLEKGYVKVRYGRPEINVGRYGKVILNPTEGDLELEEEPGASVLRKEMSELKEGDRAEVRGALMEIYTPKVFERKKGKGVVVNAAIDDGTASMRAAFYDRLAEDLLNIPLEELEKEGEDITQALDERRKEILGGEVIATVDVRHSDFSGKDELVVRDLDLDPDPREVVKGLLRETRSREE